MFSQTLMFHVTESKTETEHLT